MTKLVSKYLFGGLFKLLKQINLAKAINKGIKKFHYENIFPGQIGWAPKEVRNVYHRTSNPNFKIKNVYNERWDARVHNAPKNGLWVSEKLDIGFMNERPFEIKFEQILNKPMVQVGEIPTKKKNAIREKILRDAELAGADGVKFLGIKDNKASNQNVNFIFNPKLTLRQLTLPSTELKGIPKGERNQKQVYRFLGIGQAPKSINGTFTIENPRFGELLGNGSEQFVFADNMNPDKVLKVYYDRGFKSLDAIKKWHPQWFKRNQVPFQKRIDMEGYVKSGDYYYPVYSQERVKPFNDMTYAEWSHKYEPKIEKMLESKGFKNRLNGKIHLNDLYATNVGYDKQGNLVFFDVDAYRKGGVFKSPILT